MSHEDLKEVERSPEGRYIRYDKKLGDGAYKAVWLAFDTERGTEVAWNLVDLRRLPGREKERIKSETEILRTIKHEHIINFYQVWEKPDKEQVIFTTERVTSGSLKQYINRFKPIKIKVVKRWCRQILNAVSYLHSLSPPIIHRDLKCDNIFIHGSAGDIRIGDLGLSTARTQTHAESVLGTPEFMAPELYDEYYDERVDIYAFGMCVLEMVTNDYPYCECANAAQIFKRVASAIPPESVKRIRHTQTRKFIELCLSPVNVRPSARELLNHPYLVYKVADYRERDHGLSDVPKISEVPQFTSTLGGELAKEPSSVRPAKAISQEVILESTQDNIARIVLRLHIADKRKEIKFPFDLENDTAEAVAAEMVKELKLADSACVRLADGIFYSIRSQSSKWKDLMRYQAKTSIFMAKVPEVPTIVISASVPEPVSASKVQTVILTQSQKGPELREKFTKEADLSSTSELTGSLISLLAPLPLPENLSRRDLVHMYIDLKMKDSVADLPVSVVETPKSSRKPISTALPPEARDYQPSPETLAADALITKVLSSIKQLSLNQIQSLKVLNTKREAKVEGHLKEFLKLKEETNKEFNQEAVKLLLSWGADLRFLEDKESKEKDPP